MPRGVKPSDVQSMEDFAEKVPFIDKDASARYRESPQRSARRGCLCLARATRR